MAGVLKFLTFVLAVLTLLQFDLAQSVKNVTVPSASELATRRELIKNMTLDAFTVYSQYAWGGRTVEPIGKKSHIHVPRTGDSVVAFLTTLHLMGLKKEFNKSRKWVSGNPGNVFGNYGVSDHDIITQHIASLLSTYAQTGDRLFLQKAIELGEVVKHAFNTTTGLPAQIYNGTFHGTAFGWTFTGESSYEQPELYLLADLANNSTISTGWRDRLAKISRVINDNSQKPKGFLLPLAIDYTTGKWKSGIAGLNSRTIGIFANQLRSHLLYDGGKSHLLALYRKTVEQYAKEGQMFKSVGGNGAYIAPQIYLFEKDGNGNGHFQNDSALQNAGSRNKTQVLPPDRGIRSATCRFGPLFALATPELRKAAAKSNLAVDVEAIKYQWELASNLTRTCVFLAEQTKTGLLPDQAVLKQSTTGEQPTIVELVDSESRTNSELAETYFIFWRLTNEPVWRERSWKLAQAIQAHQRTPNGGYCPIKDVNKVPTEFSEGCEQDPLLLSATFKYLYLTQFDNPTDVLPLDKWVFNSAGHPLPICGQHPLYPQSACSGA